MTWLRHLVATRFARRTIYDRADVTRLDALRAIVQAPVIRPPATPAAPPIAKRQAPIVEIVERRSA